MGDRAGHLFQFVNTAGKKNNHRSQMTNLENIAESAFKTSDIFNYIKRQTARQDYWRQALPGYPVPGRKDNTDVGFGEGLREYLEKNLLEERVKIIARNLKLEGDTDAEQQERRRIHLLLIRQFIRSMIIQYEYRVSEIQDTQYKGNQGQPPGQQTGQNQRRGG